MSASPPVSVVLPCFNAERFVAASLDSLLGQTHAELDIVALDDASTDGTRPILEDYAKQDSRVRVISNTTNLGLIATLNRGVVEARGDYIARMDADDVAVPHRIERQVTALRQRRDVGAVGSAISLVDLEGRPLRPRPVRCVEPPAARFMALLATPIAHVTLLARAEVMRAHPYGGVPESLHTEDYEVFTRMLASGVGFLNLVESLVMVRSDPHGVSRAHEAVQVANFVACARRHLNRTLGLHPAPGVHRVVVNRMDRSTTAGELRDGIRWLAVLEDAFLRREGDARAEVRGIVEEQLVDVLVQAALKGSPAVRLAAGQLAARHTGRLRSRRARRYLAGKLRLPGADQAALSLAS